MFIFFTSAVTMATAPPPSHITCSICFEICENPQCLKCLHYYCNTCVQKMKRGSKIQCPDCRVTSSMTEVKKHFTIQNLIDDYNHRLKPVDDTDVEAVGLRVCDVCKKARKPANSFCKVCEEFLCTDCQTAHKGSKATKDYTLVHFQQLCEENQRDIRRQMKKLQDTKIDVQNKAASTKNLLKQIVESEDQVIEEINRYRRAIIKKVDQHHDLLIEEVKSINESLQETLKQTENMFEQYDRKLDDKVDLLSQVSESSDYSITMDILSNLSQQIERDLQQFILS